MVNMIKEPQGKVKREKVQQGLSPLTDKGSMKDGQSISWES